MTRRPLIPLAAAASVLLALLLPAAPVAGRGTVRSCDPVQTAPVLRPDVPTATEVLGFPLGERDVTTAESDTYLRAVDAASPRVAGGTLATSAPGPPAALRGGRQAAATSARSGWPGSPPPRPRCATPGRRRPWPACSPRTTPGDPLGRRQRARQRGERHRRRAAGALRAGRPRGLRRRRGSSTTRSWCCCRRRTRTAGRPTPGATRTASTSTATGSPAPSRRPTASCSCCAASRRCSSSTRTRWAASPTSSRRTRTRSTTRSPTSRCPGSTTCTARR